MYPATCSVTEVEVVIGVIIVFTLTEARADEVESGGEPGDSEPDAEAVVHDDTVNEETLKSTEHEVEEPLLGSVGAVVQDVAPCISTLLVKVLLAVPGAPLHLGHTEALSVCKSHVLGVAKLVVSKSSTFDVHV